MNLLKICFFSLFLCLISGCLVTPSGAVVQRRHDMLVKKADRAEAVGDYSTAIKIYIDLLSDIEFSSEKKDLIYRMKLKDLFLEQARALYWKSRMDNSTDACRNAVLTAVRAKRVYPSASDECDKIIAKLLDWLLVLENDRKSDIIKFKSDIRDDDIKLKLLCSQGNEYLKNGRFDFALEKFQDAVLVDPFYPDAVRALNKAQKLKDEDEKKAENDKLIQQEIEETYLKAVEEKQSIKMLEKKGKK